MNISEQIREVKREIALRKRVYPRWVSAGKLSDQAAERQLEAMESVLETLAELAMGGQKELFE